MSPVSLETAGDKNHEKNLPACKELSEFYHILAAIEISIVFCGIRYPISRGCLACLSFGKEDNIQRYGINSSGWVAVAPAKA